MPVPGILSRGLGYIDTALSSFGIGSAAITYAMAALNTGWCARFQAVDTRDIWSVWVNWSTVTTPGTVTVRIETIDVATGKPSGTLYDANATLAFTPAAGWQQLTFASHPTTGLVAGNEYGIVLLTTGAGTTHTLRSHLSSVGHFPANSLTAADGTTRSNFASVANSCPISTIGFSDGNEEFLGMAPFATSTSFSVYGTRSAGAKFVVPAGETWVVLGVQLGTPNPVGSPDDFRVRILDSSNALVTNASVTLPKVSVAGVTNVSSRLLAVFPALVTLTAGTYRIAVDHPAHATVVGNRHDLYNAAVRVAALNASSFIGTTTTDVTVGSPTWTDTTTDAPLMALVIDSMTAAGGGVSYARVVNS